MRLPQSQLYQGRDWTSYRWSVAEAFDTIERIHDICLCHGWSEQESPPRGLVPDLMALFDDLVCQMRLVYADVAGENGAPAPLGQGLAQIEAQAQLDELGRHIQNLWAENETQGFSALLYAAAALKTFLKKMDQ